MVLAVGECVLQWAEAQAQAQPVAITVTILFFAVTFLCRHHPLYGKNVGPKVYPIVGSLPALIRNAHRIFDFFVNEIPKTPTHTIRFVLPGGGGMYSAANVENVENVEYILKTRFEDFPKGEFIGAVLGDVLGKGIFNVDGDLWKLQRCPPSS